MFDRLVGALPHAGTVFDYHVTFGDYETSVAGSTRWGDLPVAARAESDELLNRAWEVTEDESHRNLDRVKEALTDLSDEAIMCEEDYARYAFHQVGVYDGASVFLYDEHGSEFRHRGQLDWILNESEDLQIVPADVHY